MRRLTYAALAAIALGCVPVQKLPFSKPVDAYSEGVRARASSVSASAAFLSQRGAGPSVLAVTVSAANDGEDVAFLELDRAALVIADPGGELPEVVLSASSSGSGGAPEAIDLDARAVPFAIPRGTNAAFWIAFKSAEPLPESDLPRRIVLRIPVRNAPQPMELVIAEPATARPRWVHPPIRHASYAGISAIGTPFDEGSIGILRTSGKTAAGRVIFGPSFDLGVRGGDLRGERERTIACCDLGLSFDVSISALRGRDASFGPYFTYQAVFALDDRPDKAAWHGPGAGLQFFTRLIEPMVAGALPVRPTATPLGYSSFTIAYVHLFRRGDTGGSPGMLLLFEHTLPEL